ncbi:MAG TPA: FeoB-associated Cys-rich membrane protein [Clostridiales bacterium]|nr:FeoB-associated Cys-rich membrane protein [Clostridiales bacterium]
MNIFDYALIVVIVLCFSAAVISLRHRKKKSGCSGCSGCCSDCSRYG